MALATCLASLTRRSSIESVRFIPNSCSSKIGTIHNDHSLCVHRFRVKLYSLEESRIVGSTIDAGARGTGLRGWRSRQRPLEPDLGNASVGRHRMSLQV